MATFPLDGFEDQGPRSVLHHSLTFKGLGFSPSKVGRASAIHEKDALRAQCDSGGGQHLPAQARTEGRTKTDGLNQDIRATAKAHLDLGHPERVRGIFRVRRHLMQLFETKDKSEPPFDN